MMRFPLRSRGRHLATVAFAAALMAGAVSQAATARPLHLSAWSMAAFSHFSGLRQYAVTLGVPIADYRLGGIVLRPELTASLGHMDRSGDQGTFGSVGVRARYFPGFRIGDLPVFLEGGVSPTLMDRRHYLGKDFGSDIEFISHVVAGVSFGRDDHGSLGVRVEHMSNASISRTNPGVNMVGLQASYRFNG